MKDEDKTKQELLEELTKLRDRVTDLERLEQDHQRAEEALWESEERYNRL
ncbi:MAG: hypothetical protein GWN16_04690, partial [Calditrichae bacterium]|nr:hypothetical protein [Calditrichia bacterium]